MQKPPNKNQYVHVMSKDKYILYVDICGRDVSKQTHKVQRNTFHFSQHLHSYRHKEGDKINCILCILFVLRVHTHRKIESIS